MTNEQYLQTIIGESKTVRALKVRLTKAIASEIEYIEYCKERLKKGEWGFLHGQKKYWQHEMDTHTKTLTVLHEKRQQI